MNVENKGADEKLRHSVTRQDLGQRAPAGEDFVGEVRGVGLIGAIQLVKDKASKENFDPAGKIGGYLSARAQDHGLIVRNLLDSIAFSPPLVITEAEIAEMLGRFDKAFRETLSWIRAEGLAA